MLKSTIPKARRSFMNCCICAVILVMTYLGHWLARVTDSIGRGWGGRYPKRMTVPRRTRATTGLDNYYFGNIPMSWGAVGKV